MEKSGRLVINGRFLVQDISGVQRVAREIVLEFDKSVRRGDFPYQSVVIVKPPGECVVDLDLMCIPIVEFGRGSGHFWEQVWLPIASRSSTLLCLANSAPLMALLCRTIRTLCLVHDLSFAYFPEAYAFRYRALYRLLSPAIMIGADVVATVSAAERDAILRHYRCLPIRELSVLQNGGSEVASVPTSDADGSPVVSGLPREYVLYVGSLTRRKNADALPRLASALWSRYAMPLVVVGGGGHTFAAVSGPQDASQGSLGSALVQLGQINDNRALADIYRGASCFVFPSFYEASPLPPIEAMACGIPVVVSDIPSLRERCGDAALYVDPSDGSSILAGVCRVLDDGALRSSLVKKGAERARGFTWRRQSDQLLNILKNGVGS